MRQEITFEDVQKWAEFWARTLQEIWMDIPEGEELESPHISPEDAFGCILNRVGSAETVFDLA